MENIKFEPVQVKEKTKYRVMYLYALSLICTAFFFNSPMEILNGLITMIPATGVLLTDYIELGSTGSAFFNSGLLMISFISQFNRVGWILKVGLSGRGIMLIVGFATSLGHQANVFNDNIMW